MWPRNFSVPAISEIFDDGLPGLVMDLLASKKDDWDNSEVTIGLPVTRAGMKIFKTSITILICWFYISAP